MFFKRKKKLVPPHLRTPDETPFQVYEILDEPKRPTMRENRFVSPIFGRNVKDDIVIPVMTNDKRNMDKMDSFRTNPRISKEDRIKKYGTEYPEFDLIRGKNLQDVLAHTANKASRVVKAEIVEDDFQTPTEQPTENTPKDTFNEPVREKEEPKKVYDTDFEDTLDEERTKDVFKDPEEDHYEEEVTEEEPQEEAEEETFVKTNASWVKSYQLPPMSLITKPQEPTPDLTESINKQIDIINKTFTEFQVGASVLKHTQGPTVTRYEIVLDKGVNVKKVTGISDNLKMALAATEIRIEAPIPGKSTVGIEVPNEIKQTVHFRDIVNQSKFSKAAQPLTVALGLDIDGMPVYGSIKSMPHGLVAGATGSGKSVCINTILMSLLLKYRPDELKLILIDPKMVELVNYNHLPHLLTPVITDPKAATASLRWSVEEMDRRFKAFADERVRDIDGFNDKQESNEEKMPYIVIVIDELSDLMMVSSQHVEDAIKRLTQKARACGIHLIIATQRPSTDVIKGTIKSNIPTRIAFSVASHIDSQTIIDSSGADKLLGRGDMLYVENGQSKIRVQGAFIQDSDIEHVTEYIKKQLAPNYLFDEDTLVKKIASNLDRDEYFFEVAHFVVDQDEASINKISKQFSIGFNRAQSIVESLEEYGIVSANLGSKAREVLVDKSQLESVLKKIG